MISCIPIIFFSEYPPDLKLSLDLRGQVVVLFAQEKPGFSEKAGLLNRKL